MLFDPLEGLNSPDHKAPALFRKKEVTQIIYERDYRFAQPPKMPTLHATAADGKVILTWDNAAELYTREPLIGNGNDFEGYKLYKATDKKFSDPEVITNGYGTPMYKKPIFQCDLIDNKEGFTDFGLIDGAAFYLGDDSGIQHYFVDENVEIEYIANYLRPATEKKIGNIGLQHLCQLMNRGREGVDTFINSILEKSGYNVVDVPHWWCGGGTGWMGRTDIIEAVARKRMADFDRDDIDIISTYCPSCWWILRRFSKVCKIKPKAKDIFELLL